MSRRAAVDPIARGVVANRDGRRVPGLRRVEAAALAGLSVEYDTRLERGYAVNPSETVIGMVASALAMSKAEVGYMRDMLARLGGDVGMGETTAMLTVAAGGTTELRGDDAEFRRLLGDLAVLMRDAPALVMSRLLEVVFINEFGAALWEPVLGPCHDEIPSIPRMVFLEPESSRAFFAEWELVADRCVGMLRMENARVPEDGELGRLIEELSHSAEFRTRWDRHDVVDHDTGLSTLIHPRLGSLRLPYVNLFAADERRHIVLAYCPTPGSPEHEAVLSLRGT